MPVQGLTALNSLLCGCIILEKKNSILNLMIVFLYLYILYLILVFHTCLQNVQPFTAYSQELSLLFFQFSLYLSITK